MKFKLRDANAQSHQSPAYYSHSSSSSSPYTYFPPQPIPAGFSTGNYSGGPEMFRERFDMRDAIHRELEKERIREEIIAEVRHELMMEREMAAMRSGGGGFPPPYMPLPLPPCHSSLLEPVILHRQPIGLEERIIMSMEEKNARGGGYPPEIRVFDVAPFQRFADSPIIQGIPTPFTESSHKEEIILGAKRKPQVTGESSGSGSYSDTSKKRITEEWNCAICRITATSERGLKEHLEGKKHQSKEAALIAKKSGANFGLGVELKKPMVKLAVTTVNMSSGGRKSKSGKRSGNRTSSSTSSSANVSNGLKKEVETKRKDKFKFWCEMCKVGAFSEKVMNNHKEGKKHATKLVALLLQKGKPQIPFDIKENTEVVAELKSDREEEGDDDTSVS